MPYAVIDLMQVPMFGQQEDTADVVAVPMIDGLFEEESAQGIAFDSAFGHLDDPALMDEGAASGLHGLDELRECNHVCLFYSGNPTARAE